MQCNRLLVATTVVAAGVLLSADSFAHISLQFPTSRQSDQKAGPCGRTGSTRSDNVTVMPPGATLRVRWNETINHPGHFRISFDDDGDDDFVDPAGFDDFDTAPSVLVDNIADTPGGGGSTVAITMPDIECDNCTLQVIQVMTDKAPFGDGNDIYYQCADVSLVEGAPLPVDDFEAPAGGCAVGSRSGGTGWALMLAVFALILRRTRRRPAGRGRTTTPGRTRR